MSRKQDILDEERQRDRRERIERNGHGDAYEGPKRSPAASGYPFAPIDSKTFAETAYPLKWLVEKLLVWGQPCIVGGPKKALKTSLLIALALALGSGLPFLNRFRVYGKRRVAVISGESGEHTLQETARRQCGVMGIDLADVDVYWHFVLPQLADMLQVADLKAGLQQYGIEVLILDPLYLCLLAGQGDQGLQASNLFEMGPLLLAVARACLSAGCTPILIHHARKNINEPFEPLDLEHLAYSGIQEFARQWLLINRREPYETGSGMHRLWMTAGGSAGHSGCWGLDIDEGQLDEDFGGRRWNVSIVAATDVREAQASEGDSRQQQSRKAGDDADDTKVLIALDELDLQKDGVSFRKVRDLARIGNPKMVRAVHRLVTAGIIEELRLDQQAGNGAVRRDVQCIRRFRHEHQNALV